MAAGLFHLAKRFFGALRPGAPAPSDERWAIDQLLPGEAEIWARMNNPDRRHAIQVAQAVAAGCAQADPPLPFDRTVAAAALLHDSGKIASRLRTPARVMATIVWAVADDAMADRWIDGRQGRIRARLARYRRHPELGGQMLRQAGSAPLTHDWAAQHHQPEDRWTVPLEIGRVLKACDDD